MLVYDIESTKQAKGSLNRRLTLNKVGSSCLYLDEVIDVRFISAKSKYVLLCSNSETIKLLNLETRQTELYKGHSDIVLCLDIVVCSDDHTGTKEDHALFLSGAKDNSVKLWELDTAKPF